MVITPSLHQRLSLQDRVRGDFFAHFPVQRDRLDRTGMGRHAADSEERFRRISPIRLEDLTGAGPLVTDLAFDSSRTENTQNGSSNVRNMTRDSRARYAPMQWLRAASHAFAYSEEDLTLLAHVGAQALQRAGVVADDIVGILPTSQTRESAQFLLGASVIGAACVIELDATDDHDFGMTTANAAVPHVIIGEADKVEEWLLRHEDADAFSRLHTVIVIDDYARADDQRAVDQIEHRLEHHTIVMLRTWAPPGVFSSWTQCRGGLGFHVAGESELLELLDPLTGVPVPNGVPGEVVWTGLQWSATSMLRLATGYGAVLHGGVCPSCGSATSRIEHVRDVVGFPLALDACDAIGDWQAELYRTATQDELMLWIELAEQNESLRVLTIVEREVGAASVQFTTKEEIMHRRADAKGERFADRRAYFREADDLLGHGSARGRQER